MVVASFVEKLVRRIREKESILCVGIDPSLAKEHSREDIHSTNLKDKLIKYCINIIQQTAPYVCCYKPNIAFFEQYGPLGLEVLEYICKSIPKDIPIILDAKRAAVNEAAEAYADAFYSIYNADCVTVDPYLGEDAIIPFIRREGKGVFVVCRSSNPHSSDIQRIKVNIDKDSNISKQERDDDIQQLLFMQVAKMCDHCRAKTEPHLSENGGLVGLVVGATYPEDMKRIRKAYPHLWFLTPGVGAQGGDLEAAIKAGIREDGLGLIVNVGRAISEAADPGKAAESIRNEMRSIIKKVCKAPR